MKTSFDTIRKRIEANHRYIQCGDPVSVCGAWRHEAERLYKIVMNLLDAWPNDDVPVEVFE